jgi:hypothetical protein
VVGAGGAAQRNTEDGGGWGRGMQQVAPGLGTEDSLHANG